MSDEVDDPKPEKDLIAARINDEGYADVEIAAYQLEGPYNFGRFLADIARHGAIAYANAWSLDEDYALKEICEGLSDQLREQATRIDQIMSGSLDS